VSIYLPLSTIAAIDAAAEQAGKSRSGIVAEVVKEKFGA
jgi:hypothetical protein